MAQSSNQHPEPYADETEDEAFDAASDWDGAEEMEDDPEVDAVAEAPGASKSRRRIERYLESKQLEDWLTEVFDEPERGRRRRATRSRTRRASRTIN